MADPLDILTFDEASSGMLNLPDDNGLLPIYITGVSRRLDDLCGPIVQRTVTDERHNGGVQWLRLRQQPASAVTEVTEYDSGTATALTAELDDTVPADGYVYDNGWLARRQNGVGCVWAAGLQNVKVTYTAGRYATTLEVDEVFKMAAHLCVQHVWLTTQGGQGDFGLPLTFSIPNAAVELLGDHVTTPILEGLR